MKWEKLKPIVVLTAICVIVSAALVGTYGLTKPVIDAAKAAEANAALSAVLPDGTDFEEVTVTAENVLNAYKAGNGAGYVFQAQGKGFAGMITVMVGISSDGAITGTQVMEHGETPGIGDRIEKEAHFQEQYLGKDYNLEGIEFLSGATFSSKGFNAAVGNAFVAYGELAGIAIEAPTEEKVYPEAELIAEMLGEGYTELETAPEGTDSAYQSELGYAFNVHAAGFSGDLHILVAIDNNGAIIASKLYQHTETPNEYEGIDGSKLAKSSYSKKWIGVTAETPDSELPMVSKATYTSNGYKEAVKLAFAAFARKHQGVVLNTDAIFDVQVKRLHEYKRQLLNVLHITYLYQQLKNDPHFDFTPRVYLFGAKAAPGYSVAKEICSYAAAFDGPVDRIVLTGGIAHSKYVVDEVSRMTAFLAPMEVVAGEFEMEALALGALRVLRGEEEPQIYA